MVAPAHLDVACDILAIDFDARSIHLLSSAAACIHLLIMPARVKSAALAPVDKNYMEIDDGDEVVREIDVFLSPELASQLYLLQYPLEHGSAYVLPTEARIKPQHNILELSEPFPQNTELQGEFRHLDRRVFESHTIPVTTHLCVGKFKEGENGTALHLVPLNHIAQMRPSFRHLTVEETADNDPLYETEDEAETDQSKDKQTKPIVFQRKETDRAANARRSSYAFMRMSVESEPWMDLEVCDEGSIEHHSVLDKVYCPATDSMVIQNDDLSEAAYVVSLNYLPRDGEDPASLLEAERTDPTGVVTQMTSLMLGGCPIPFAILRSQVSPQVSNRELLTALSACAILVKGNFCIRSKLLNIPNPMQRARTFILMLLHQGTVERARLDRAFQGRVSSERLMSLLQQTGRLTPEGWALKVEEDFSFQAHYPDQVRAHQIDMERLEDKFQAELMRYRSDN